MGKIAKLLIWIAILAVIGIAVYPRMMKAKGDLPTETSPAPRPALPVTVHKVMPGLLQDTIQINGNVLAEEQAELRAELAGRVTAIHFEEGKAVSEGDVLVTIDNTELVADQRRLQHEWALAQETFKRQKNLLAKGTTSQENYDRVANRLQTLAAELEVVAARLEKTIIRAPFDGIMGFRYVSPGGYVTSNTRIATIQQIDTIKVGFAVPEKYARQVGMGNTIHFTVPGRDTEYEGTVYAIEPRIDAATRTLPIRARATNSDGALLPGAFVSVLLVLDEIDNALLVPGEAVIPAPTGQKVFVAVDGKAQERLVTTGIRSAASVEITSGLKPGDLVIRTGILQLREGMAVTVVEAATEASE